MEQLKKRQILLQIPANSDFVSSCFEEFVFPLCLRPSRNQVFSKATDHKWLINSLWRWVLKKAQLAEMMRQRNSLVRRAHRWTCRLWEATNILFEKDELTFVYDTPGRLITKTDKVPYEKGYHWHLNELLFTVPYTAERAFLRKLTGLLTKFGC